MNTRTLIICAGIILLAIGVAVAGGPIPKVVNFDGAVDGGGSKDIHPSIYTGPIIFSHEKHFMDYGAKCGDCHHDSDGEPIVGYSSDKTFTCGDCHDEEGLIRGPIAENAASDEDLIAHRANVLHMRCIGCHRNYNAEKKSVQAPVSCRICHTKRPQDWTIE
jgi:hypothetical protein